MMMKRAAEQRVGWMEASWKEFRKVGSEQVSVATLTGEIREADPLGMGRCSGRLVSSNGGPPRCC